MLGRTIALVTLVLTLVVGSACQVASAALPSTVGKSADPAQTAAAPPIPAQRAAVSTFDPTAVHASLQPVATGLAEPTGAFSAFDGSDRLFLLERGGRVLIMRAGQLQPRPFLDIRSVIRSSGQEQGLLGIVFHPRYRENGYFYVNYTARNGDDTVARYHVSTDTDSADPETGAVMIAIPDPAPNHNGGNLVFGPDGYLYIGFGDGGGGGDQFGNGQNMGALLGKMLRIDVDAQFPYGIPPDNPFVNTPGARPEIWAYGLRNPWRYAFDPASGNLFIADVGQNAYEEINFQPAGVGGQNWGWPIMEGFHCYPENRRCDISGLSQPVAEYGRDQGCSITGGFVYRGSASPAAQGAFIYGDFCTGRIWALYAGDDAAWHQMQILQTQLEISSFGEDESGEIYVVSLEPGAVYRLRLG